MSNATTKYLIRITNSDTVWYRNSSGELGVYDTLEEAVGVLDNQWHLDGEPVLIELTV